jgi:biopolymer transport protein ExbD
MADINVTPLVDVVLVLLIIFMVITPMLVSGVDVKLPMAVQTEKVKDDGQHVIVSIDADKNIYVDKDLVTLDTLAEKMIKIMENEDGGPLFTPILVKGDETLTWEDVHVVLDRIKTDLSRTEILLATDSPEAH